MEEKKKPKEGIDTEEDGFFGLFFQIGESQKKGSQ